MSPKVKLTDDAVQLLDAYLVELFASIASKAEEIVKKARKDKLSCDDVKKAVMSVF